MFYEGTRTEKTAEGVLFYEQDILSCRYLFSGNAEINLKAIFETPGLGLVLFEDNGKEAAEAEHAYLFKVGYEEFGVFEKRGENIKSIHSQSCLLAPPAEVSIWFKIKGRSVTVYWDAEPLGEIKLAKTLKQYRFGIYSSAGNTITYLSTKEATPKHWRSNIANARGGRIHFSTNTIRLEEAQQDIEVEEERVPLKAGDYLLRYEADNAVQPVVFRSKDSKIRDEKKNLLHDSNAFTLEKDEAVSIKFKGQNVSIKNISIQEREDECFIPTGPEDTAGRNGSRIRILYGNDLKEVRWKAKVTKTPAHKTGEPLEWFLVGTDETKVVFPEGGNDLGKDFDYKLTIDTMHLGMKSASVNYEFSLVRELDDTYFTILSNVEGTLYELILVLADGTEIDVTKQAAYKAYVQEDIDGPILAESDTGDTMDLSAAGFIKPDGSYRFSNVQREIFWQPGGILTFESVPLNRKSAIRAWGLKEGETYSLDRLFHISDEADSAPFAFSACVEEIPQDLYTLDVTIPAISMMEEVLTSQYQCIIVDYQKDNSYCVNWSELSGSYEVDVSADCDTVYLYYSEKKDSYKVTDIAPSKTGPVVLRKKESL